MESSPRDVVNALRPAQRHIFVTYLLHDDDGISATTVRRKSPTIVKADIYWVLPVGDGDTASVRELIWRPGSSSSNPVLLATPSSLAWCRKSCFVRHTASTVKQPLPPDNIASGSCVETCMRFNGSFIAAAAGAVVAAQQKTLQTRIDAFWQNTANILKIAFRLLDIEMRLICVKLRKPIPMTVS